MKYRPEIDGLRAIAVISVLIYHAKFYIGSDVLLSGGFLGVDIFFVISGFLITKIITQEIRGQQFTYTNFYERRTRRILPALFAVMLVSLPFAWLWILPEKLIEFSHSILGALFFSSNIVFFFEDSYTAAPSALKPFLHTWSLGIEEQFYILLPFILLFLVNRFTKTSILLTLILGTFFSLVLAQGLSVRATDANFFLLPSRAWELLLGSIVAFIDLDHQATLAKIKHKGHISLIALSVLITALFSFTDATPHPSLYTLAPVLSCAILICLGTEKHYVTRALSNVVFVKIGLISYSLYLWHFPIFAFYRLQFGEPGLAIKSVLLGLSFFLAIVSYRWIEKPFRDRQSLNAKRLSLILLACFFVIVLFQLAVIMNRGFTSRLGNTANYVNESKAIVYPNGAEPGTATNPLVALGDSHARVFSHPLALLAKNQGRPFIQIARDGCPMVKQAILFQDGKRIDGCHTSYQSRLNAIKHFKDGIYFYSGRFALYQNGDRFAEEPGYPVLLTNKRSGEPSPEALRNLVVETIEDLLKQNIKVVLVYPVPEMGFDVPKTFVKNYGSVSPLKLKQELETNPLSIKRIKFTQRTKKIVEAFDSIPNNTLLIRLDPAKVLCDQTKCYANDRNELFYYDDNHISPNAAQRLIDSIVPELRNRGWIE